MATIRMYVPEPTLNNEQKELLISFYEQDPTLTSWWSFDEDQKLELLLADRVTNPEYLIGRVNEHLQDLAFNNGVNFYAI